MLLGPAGVGKSYTLKKIIEALREAHGEANVHVTAFQHSSARIVHGDTLLHFLHGVGKKQRQWLVVDECSQVPLYGWDALAALKLVGWKFVIAGDFEGQLPPIKDRWGKADTIGDSAMMRSLANGLRARLTVNRRCKDDPEHFEWYTGLYRRKGEDLRRLAAEAAERFPCHMNAIQTVDHALVVSHKARILINARLNLSAAAAVERKLLVPSELASGLTTMKAQAMYIWEGLVLIGCATKRQKGIANGVLYTVVRLGEDDVTVLAVEQMRRASDTEVVLSLQEVASCLRLTYAMTYHQAQGLTIQKGKKVALLGTRTPQFTHPKLVVGASRVEQGCDLLVPSKTVELRWLKDADRSFTALDELSEERMRELEAAEEEQEQEEEEDAPEEEEEAEPEEEDEDESSTTAEDGGQQQEESDDDDRDLADVWHNPLA